MPETLKHDSLVSDIVVKEEKEDTVEPALVQPVRTSSPP